MVGKFKILSNFRIDIHLEAPRLKCEHLTDKRRGEPSEEMRKQVDAAKVVQKNHCGNEGALFNAYLEPKDLEKYCLLDKEAE